MKAITMQNELYLALLEAKKDNTQKLSSYIDSVGVTKLISDIENLLQLQREECANEAELKETIPHSAIYDVVNKESIINANILNQ